MELWYTRRALDEALDGGRYAYGAAYAHGRLHVTPQVANDVRYEVLCRLPQRRGRRRGMQPGLLSPHPYSDPLPNTTVALAGVSSL